MVLMSDFASAISLSATLFATCVVMTSWLGYPTSGRFSPDMTAWLQRFAGRCKSVMVINQKRGHAEQSGSTDLPACTLRGQARMPVATAGRNACPT